MNIFFLDRNPKLAAKFHEDKHSVKMPTEYAQLLSTALHMSGSNVNKYVYRPTHIHHPCTKWAAKSLRHWEWLWLLGHHLGNEYTRRYGRIHKATRVLRNLPLPDRIEDRGWEDPPQAMPDDYKDNDTITAYRNFYLYDKVRFAKWNHSEQPYWWNNVT